MAQVFQAYYFVVITVLFMCATVPYTAMALDLSRLYGHMQVKRNGESSHVNTIKPIANCTKRTNDCTR